MVTALHIIDWIVIGAYLVFLVGFALWLARGQGSREDYYVAGRNMGAWPIALSVMATQCSTNSILGAPAFVAFAAGGGLIWLQYELALPIAMLILMLFVMPIFLRAKVVSVYSFLEQRFDRKTRLTIAGLFLFIRAFATAVTVYSIAIVIDLITGMGFVAAVIVLGVFTVIYDVVGGIRGVVYSDVIQLVILVLILLFVLVKLVGFEEGIFNMLSAISPERRVALNFSDHGLGDGETFAFWPMLFGGIFLYVSYYGCDQSQVQRLMCAKNQKQLNIALLLNGLLRFPLVLLYCFVGVGIAAFAVSRPEFIQALPLINEAPNYNLAVPHFMLSQLPVGLVGLAMVALFAAAMSSLDSVLNSLSATTMEDFIRPHLNKSWSPKKELWISRLTTVFWGSVTLAMAFYVDDIAPTVLEAINKIGSLANGSILAVFILAMYTRRVRGGMVLLGLGVGIFLNGLLWKWAPQISWLWWNVFGFVVTGGVALLLDSMASLLKSESVITNYKGDLLRPGISETPHSSLRMYSGILIVFFFLMLCFLALL